MFQIIFFNKGLIFPKTWPGIKDKFLRSSKNHKFAKNKETEFVTLPFLLLKDFFDEFLSTVKISEDFTEGNAKKIKIKD